MSYKPPLYKQLLHNLRRCLAKYWLSIQPAVKIAITGSFGKTNLTQTVASVLSASGNTVVTDVNLDTLYNVPITALKLMPWTKYAVFELGVDHPYEMNQYLKIVKPKIAVITGISPVHTDQEHLGSLENLIKEKRKLIEALPKNGFAILNWDDENVRKMADYTKAKIYFYGTDPKNCHVYVNKESIKLSFKGTSFQMNNSFAPGDTREREKNPGQNLVQIKTNLIGSHHIYTVMAAYLVNRIIKLSEKKFIETISLIKPLSGRMSIEDGPRQTIILNDSLRANPASTAAGLTTFSQIDYSKGRKIAVLAEMGELADPKTEHEKIGKLIAGLKIDLLVSIGPNQKFVYDQAVANGFPKNQAFFVKNVAEAGEILKKIVKPNDFIYLKGSLLRHVERVLLILKGERITCTQVSCNRYYHCSKCNLLSK